jgi:hemoglobin
VTPRDDELPLYDLLGEPKITAIVAGFYRRVPSDPILGPMYPAHDLAGAEHRLREFLIQRLGGPARYSAARGHPRLRLRHVHFRIDHAARDRWVELMMAAVDEQQLAAGHRAWLANFFGELATFLINSD